MKAVVVGGGLLGMLTARELSKAGMSVTLLERGKMGGESSWAGGGILSPLYPWNYADSVNALARWSQRQYPQLVAELIDEGGMDPQWIQSGLLMLDSESCQKAGPSSLISRATDWARQYGMACERLDERALHEQELELAPGYAQGLLFPEVAQVRNPRLVKSLQTSCLKRGIQLVAQCAVTDLLVSDAGASTSHRVTGVKTEEADYEADVVVVCAGAWSAHLLAHLNIELPIKPMKGQMILYRTQPGRINRITLSDGHYVIPRRDGRILAGSTLEDVGFDKSTSDDALTELRQFAEGLFPCLARAEIEHHWSGLRPESPAGIPYICNVPGVEGLFLNTGHFRNGVVLAPASARLVTDLVLGHEPFLDPADYGCERG